MYERERPKLEYRHVLRGEERLKMAALIYHLRYDMALQWKQIAEITGMTVYKACTIYTTTDKSRYLKYLEEYENE